MGRISKQKLKSIQEANRRLLGEQSFSYPGLGKTEISLKKKDGTDKMSYDLEKEKQVIIKKIKTDVNGHPSSEVSRMVKTVTASFDKLINELK